MPSKSEAEIYSKPRADTRRFGPLAREHRPHECDEEADRGYTRDAILQH